MSDAALNVVAVVHVLVCLMLICLVLLQDPKGGAAGGIFGGGGSNTLLGATGATTFLTKLTRYTAIAFGGLCLLMVWMLKQNSTSVVDQLGAPAAAAVAPVSEAAKEPSTEGAPKDAAPGTTDGAKPTENAPPSSH